MSLNVARIACLAIATWFLYVKDYDKVAFWSLETVALCCIRSEVSE